MARSSPSTRPPSSTLESTNPSAPPKARLRDKRADWLAYNRRADIVLLPSGKKSAQFFPHSADDSKLIWQMPKPPLAKVQGGSVADTELNQRAGERMLSGAFLFGDRKKERSKASPQSRRGRRESRRKKSADRSGRADRIRREAAGVPAAARIQIRVDVGISWRQSRGWRDAGSCSCAGVAGGTGRRGARSDPKCIACSINIGKRACHSS